MRDQHFVDARGPYSRTKWLQDGTRRLLQKNRSTTDFHGIHKVKMLLLGGTILVYICYVRLHAFTYPTPIETASQHNFTSASEVVGDHVHNLTAHPSTNREPNPHMFKSISTCLTHRPFQMTTAPPSPPQDTIQTTAASSSPKLRPCIIIPSHPQSDRTLKPGNNPQTPQSRESEASRPMARKPTQYCPRAQPTPSSTHHLLQLVITHQPSLGLPDLPEPGIDASDQKPCPMLPPLEGTQHHLVHRSFQVPIIHFSHPAYQEPSTRFSSCRALF